MILILLRCCCCVGYNSMMCISSMKRMLRWGAYLVPLGDSFGVVCMMMEKRVPQIVIVTYHVQLFGNHYLTISVVYDKRKNFANDDDACYCSTWKVWVFRSCQCCQMMACFSISYRGV